MNCCTMDSNSHREKIKCLLRYDFIDDFTPVGCFVVLVAQSLVFCMMFSGSCCSIFSCLCGAVLFLLLNL
jgi:hypothetical protein